VKRSFLPLLALLAIPALAADRFELTISKTGFRPPRLDVRRGEPVRLHITSADGEHCFALDAFRVEKRVVPGRVTVVDLTPDRAGTFPFYDCLVPEGETRTGQLVVAE
jgi:heme/copper-type cytochrome/quinol oxidase subunit 2